jgi:Kef-type K+ transport system membrane component KefB
MKPWIDHIDYLLLFLGTAIILVSVVAYIKTKRAQSAGRHDLVVTVSLFAYGIIALIGVGVDGSAGLLILGRVKTPHAPPITLHGGSFHAQTVDIDDWHDTDPGDFVVTMPRGQSGSEVVTITGLDDNDKLVSKPLTAQSNWRINFVYRTCQKEADPKTFLAIGSLKDRQGAGGQLQGAAVYILGDHSGSATAGTFTHSKDSHYLNYDVIGKCNCEGPECDNYARDHPHHIELFGFVNPPFRKLGCGEHGNACEVTIDTIPPTN